MKRFFSYAGSVFGRLASLNFNAIILLLKCSHCVFHMACLRQIDWREGKKISRQWYLLDTLPERRTVTIHREISARGSLMPAEHGSKLFSDTLVPDKAVRSRPLDHMRQIPFVVAPRPVALEIPLMDSFYIISFLQFLSVAVFPKTIASSMDCRHCYGNASVYDG